MTGVRPRSAPSRRDAGWLVAPAVAPSRCAGCGADGPSAGSVRCAGRGADGPPAGLLRAAGRGLGAVLAGLVLLGGCGVPAQDEPHPVVLPRRPLNATVSATAAEPAGEVAQVICLTRDERLVETVRRSGTPLSPQRQLDLLVTGPTPAERAQGLSTALAATALTVTVPAGSTTAAVEIAAPEEGAGRVVEALAYGQIVCTLTSRTGIAAVTFLRAGQRLQVPDGNGAVTEEPLTAADYRVLIDPP